MFDSVDERPEISPRLRNALVADLVHDAPDTADVDRILLGTNRMDEEDCRVALCRQLGFKVQDHFADLPETLSMLLAELDHQLRNWPISDHTKVATQIAETLTKALTGPQAYATLLAGPGRWGKEPVAADRKVATLDVPLRETLKRCLASSLNNMLDNWQRWNILDLSRQWRAAREREHAAEATRNARSDDSSSLIGRRRSAQEVADARKWREAAGFRPPSPPY